MIQEALEAMVVEAEADTKGTGASEEVSPEAGTEVLAISIVAVPTRPRWWCSHHSLLLVPIKHPMLQSRKL
jgi:hypothetical protein